MKKNYVLFFLSILFLFSCGNDDGLTPLLIETNPDTVTIVQDSEIEIFIFSNDLNIPSSGELALSQPTKGSVEIIDSNNTPNNPSDDHIKYTANPNEVGLDSFEYTICTTSGNCKTETITVTITTSSSVLYDLENMPFQSLSDYQFFQGDLKNLDPTNGVVPYMLNATLFSDYAKKKRFIWMPNNSKASFVNENELLDFPVGTILIKNFYYDNVWPENTTQIIETRLIIRKQEGWVFATYAWNEEQLEAVLDLNGSYVDLQWEQAGEVKSVQYRIPSEPECHTCHKVSEIARPIGPKARNLNLSYSYNDGTSNQLEKWVSLGYLENTLPETIAQLPDYNDINTPLNQRVRAYLEINCAHCHSENTHCSYRPMRLDFLSTEDYVNMGVCVDADTDLGLGLGHIVEPGDARNSVLHYRLSTTEPSTRMPLLARTIVHVEGVQLIEQWIESLNINCN
ncbi:SO2930 family diheme c-type cytochrome [Winogradskyella sp. PC D3.3]